MTNPTEVELKFLVPPAARSAVAAEMARVTSTLQRTTLAAVYLDTPDGRLANAGFAWRLRREGRQWVQTLKAPGGSAVERFEHEVVRPGPTADATLHAATGPGRKLAALLERCAADGVEPGVRCRTEVRRLSRRTRTRGGVVEIAFDEGRILAGEARQRICEVEFEVVSGPASAMLALAERWRRRFGLIHDPRRKSERGDRLADGFEFPPLRKAQRPAYAATAGVAAAFAAVVDECLAQVMHNGLGLCVGEPASRAEHVHQLRVGVRRLRSALRSFQGWVPEVPAPLVDGLRGLFVELGTARDADVLGEGVAAALREVGAPTLTLPVDGEGVDPVELMRSDRAQALLLAWLAWRAGGEPAADAEPAAADEPIALAGAAARRLRRWHRRIAGDWKNFDGLDEPALHALRKHIKRQRYAVEFLAPALRRRTVQRYLKVLAPIQERLGDLNDLFVARERYHALVASDPRAWFALGWLAARIAEVRALAKPALGDLAASRPPSARGRGPG